MISWKNMFGRNDLIAENANLRLQIRDLEQQLEISRDIKGKQSEINHLLKIVNGLKEDAELTSALVFSLTKQVAEEKQRGDCLLNALDQERARSYGAIDRAAVAERKLKGVLEMKNISDEEAGQLWGASNNPKEVENFNTQTRVQWRAGKQAFRDHQIAMSDLFDQMEAKAKTTPLTNDDIAFYREYASFQAGRKI